ncbi:MAG: MAPEG family protein [Rhodobacteraceae bacterium]|nr:MAPEG family protein [Paracoccaceae bacterium]
MQDTALAAVAIYFGLNAAILLWMAARIIGLRRRYDVPIGDGGNAHLMRAMRGQANFVELVPMALSMLLVMALMGVPAWVIHLLARR